MPRKRPVGPLTEEDYKEINRQLVECSKLAEECANAKQAGIPCDQSIAFCADLQAKLSALKNAYFPDKP